MEGQVTHLSRKKHRLFIDPPAFGDQLGARSIAELVAT